MYFHMNSLQLVVITVATIPPGEGMNSADDHTQPV